jgi:hypothetical protein
MASVEVLVPFLDEEENRLRALGSAFECSSARASALEKAGLARPCDASRVVRYGGQPAREQAGGNAAATAKAETAKDGAAKAEAAQESTTKAEAAQDGTGGAQATRAELAAQAEALGIPVPPKANRNRIAALIAKATGGETGE